MSTETAVTPLVGASAIHMMFRPWWVAWASLHWGFRKPACVLWCCAGRITSEMAFSALGIDTLYPIDVVLFYRELVATLTHERDLAQMIVDVMPVAERKHMKRIYAGKQVFEAGENRRTIAQLVNEVFAPNYLPRLRESDDSDKARISDGRLFAEGLRRTLTMRSEDPSLEPSRIPLILISDECPSLIETIPALESDRDKNPEDTKLVGNEQDSIWEAAKTCFREYPNIIGSLPAVVKRQMAIAKGLTPMQRYLNAIEFDYKNKPGRITKRR